MLISDLSASSQVFRDHVVPDYLSNLAVGVKPFLKCSLISMLKTTSLSKGFSDQLERDGSLSKQHFLSLSPWKRWNLFINHFLVLLVQILLLAVIVIFHIEKKQAETRFGEKLKFGLCRKLHIGKLLTNGLQVPPTRQFQSIYRILLCLIGIRESQRAVEIYL